MRPFVGASAPFSKTNTQTACRDTSTRAMDDAAAGAPDDASIEAVLEEARVELLLQGMPAAPRGFEHHGDGATAEDADADTDDAEYHEVEEEDDVDSDGDDDGGADPEEEEEEEEEVVEGNVHNVNVAPSISWRTRDQEGKTPAEEFGRMAVNDTDISDIAAASTTVPTASNLGSTHENAVAGTEPRTPTPASTPAPPPTPHYQQHQQLQREEEQGQQQQHSAPIQHHQQQQQQAPSLRSKPAWRWRPSKRRLEEGDNDPRWLARRKHFFVLSDAGKPIYSRYGMDR